MNFRMIIWTTGVMFTDVGCPALHKDLQAVFYLKSVRQLCAQNGRTLGQKRSLT